MGEAGEAGKDGFKCPEGLAAADIDADGKVDLLAGNYWFKHQGGEDRSPQFGAVEAPHFATQHRARKGSASTKICCGCSTEVMTPPENKQRKIWVHTSVNVAGLKEDWWNIIGRAQQKPS